MKHSRKKYSAIFLSLTIVLSSFGTFSFVFADDISKIKSVFLKTDQQVPDLPKPLPENKLTSASQPGDFYENARVGTQFASDKYHLTDKDVQGLLAKGFTIKQILQADDEGNKTNQDPKELLQKQQNKQLQVNNNSNSSKSLETQFLAQLAQKYKKEYEKLKKEPFSDDDMFTLLSLWDQHLAPSFDDLVKAYKLSGEKYVDQILKENKRYGDNVSKDKKVKFGLNDEDVVGLSDDILDRLEVTAKKENTSVKKLTQELQKQRKTEQEDKQKK